jgi:MFS transporter, DHA1 family, inner membrane transport protein
MDQKRVALAAGAFVVAADGTLVVGLLQGISGDLGVSLAAAGQAVSVFAAVYALAGPLFALFFRRLSPKGALLSSLALFVVANAITALASNLPTLLSGRALAAAAAAMFMPAASVAATATTEPGQHGRALSVVVSGGAAGIALGVPAGTWVGTLSSWRVAFLLVAGLALIAAGALGLLIPAGEGVRPARPVSPTLDRRSLRVLFGTCVWALGSFTFFTYVSLILQRAAGVGGSQLALFLLLYGAFGIIGSMAAGWLTDQTSARTALIVALPLIAVSLIGLGILTWGARGDATATAVCAVLFALYAMATWSVTPPQQHRLLALGGEPRVALALNASTLYGGVALGGIVGGVLLGSGHSVAILCWVAAAIEVAALAVLQVPDTVAAGTAQHPEIAATLDAAASRLEHRNALSFRRGSRDWSHRPP